MFNWLENEKYPDSKDLTYSSHYLERRSMRSIEFLRESLASFHIFLDSNFISGLNKLVSSILNRHVTFSERNSQISQ
jgi:hypothetical protein